MIDSLENRLLRFVLDNENPILNFQIGLAYEEEGQTAAAVGFYLRSAEFSYGDTLIPYEALLRAAICLRNQGARLYSVRGLLLRAISILPNRPEAYYLLANVYERMKQWSECYTFAKIGKQKVKNNIPSLHTNVEYYGDYVFLMEQGVAAWYLGLFAEAMYIFRQLEKRTDLQPSFRLAIENNLKNLVDINPYPLRYTDDLYDRWRWKFPGLKMIRRNYSQVFQDLFVLYILNGKRKGTFLEIGSNDPYLASNTALLEKQFEWKGIAIDRDENEVKKYREKRQSTCFCADALTIKYEDLSLPNDVDYLQIDIEPPEGNLEVLHQIPFDTHRFAVITFEHDHYRDPSGTVRKRSREYLRSLGYVLVVGNVAINKYSPFEDWWVHPDLVNMKRVQSMMVDKEDVSIMENMFNFYFKRDAKYRKNKKVFTAL